MFVIVLLKNSRILNFSSLFSNLATRMAHPVAVMVVVEVGAVVVVTVVVYWFYCALQLASPT
jgi:hypothetical protein